MNTSKEWPLTRLSRLQNIWHLRLCMSILMHSRSSSIWRFKKRMSSSRGFIKNSQSLMISYSMGYLLLRSNLGLLIRIVSWTFLNRLLTTIRCRRRWTSILETFLDQHRSKTPAMESSNVTLSWSANSEILGSPDRQAKDTTVPSPTLVRRRKSTSNPSNIQLWKTWVKTANSNTSTSS